MQLSFSKSGWRTGIVLLLSIILVERITSVCAQYDWRAATNLLTLVFAILLLLAVVFGFTAKIKILGRMLWLLLILSYCVYIGVIVYKFYTDSSD
jgi:hypothetical protein